MADQGAGTSQERAVGWLRLAVACFVAGLGVACGGGGSGDGAGEFVLGQASLRVATTRLPVGSVGVPYALQLEVSGGAASGPATWRVRRGHLPAGLALSAAGRIEGTPSTAGAEPFEVSVRIGAREAAQDLGIAIDTLALVASSGLVEGQAWTGRDIVLDVLGAQGTVELTASKNESSGTWIARASDGLRGTWRIGGHGDTMDTFTARELATGRTATLELPNRTDPLAAHHAQFGASDVWFVDDTARTGSHAFATDLHEVLTRVGLRAAASTGQLGDHVDALAAMAVRRVMLRRVHLHYGLPLDGSPTSPTALPISLPWSRPDGFALPAPAQALPGSAARYSAIALVHGDTPGQAGAALVDNLDNGAHEHNAPSPDFARLGVFPDVIAAFMALPQRSLAGDPIRPGDEAVLLACLYDDARPADTRAARIDRMILDLGEALGTVVAHEIGHSLGLTHTEPPQSTSLMNAAVPVGPGALPRFHSGDLAHLRAALPGPGRTAAGAAALLLHGAPKFCTCGMALQQTRK